MSSLGTSIAEGDMSLHKFKFDFDKKKIINNEIIPIYERIRDIKFNDNKKKLYLFLESDNWVPGTSSIAIISSKNFDD